MLPVPAKRRVNGWNKHALDRCSCKDLTSNSSQLHLLNEQGDLPFLLHISDHYIVGDTQRIVSVEYLFGRPVIASNFQLGNCHLELS